jgi:transaldolase
LIEEDGVSGVTSNPSIFEKAIAESHDYDEAIAALTMQGKAADEVYESLTVEDIQMVADLLRPTYDRTDGQDGFVSLDITAWQYEWNDCGSPPALVLVNRGR